MDATTATAQIFSNIATGEGLTFTNLHIPNLKAT